MCHRGELEEERLAREERDLEAGPRRFEADDEHIQPAQALYQHPNGAPREALDLFLIVLDDALEDRERVAERVAYDLKIAAARDRLAERQREPAHRFGDARGDLLSALFGVDVLPDGFSRPADHFRQGFRCRARTERAETHGDRRARHPGQGRRDLAR